MRAPLLSGFCNPSNPDDSHSRCAGCGCACHAHLPPVLIDRGDTVTEVGAAVERLEAALPLLLEACTDPQATDMAELLWLIQQSRVALQAMERQVEDTCARAMLADDVRTDTLVVERHRSTDRKTWDHDAWKHDARNKVLRALGLAGSQGVLSSDGEVLDASVLWDALARLQSVHGSAAPKVTALRELGLDARDYCETSPGAWHVKVQRMADLETETTEDVA